MAPYRTSFKFGAVVLVDSVPTDEEPQTGVWLRDVVLLPLLSENGWPRVRYFRVEDRAQLFSVLGEVERVVRDAGLAPVLHIESHGTEEGIALADGSLVAWGLLKSRLTEINKGCRMNLLTVMSMCHGGHLASQLMQVTEPAPVWALIGTAKEVLPCRLQEAFQEFYTELLTAYDGRAAIDAMNRRHRDSTWDLKLEIAEVMFCRLWRQYERTMCTTEQLQTREGRMVDHLMRTSHYNLRAAMHGRLVAKEWLSNNEALFERYRRMFLMLDLYPENERRFQLRHEDCV